MVAAAVTVSWLAARAPRLALASLVLPMAPLWASLEGGHLASADLPALETLAFETLSAPGPRALLVTRTDFVAGAVMLGQDVDRLRPDLAHLVQGLSTSSWHWRSLASHPAFDGEPHRGPGSDPRVAYVLGGLARARGQVEIAVEDATLLGERGVVRGPLLVEGDDGVGDRATAERTMGALASSLGWTGLGDHEAGAQVVRDVIVRRAPMLVARERAARARSELARAAPAAEDALALLADGRATRAPALWIRDPAWFLASREDVVRAVAVLLDQQGHAARAAELLGRQQERGDDLAIAQLAALELSDGLVGPARTTFAAFRARHPRLHSPAIDALALGLAE